MPISRPPHGDDLRRVGATLECLKVSAQDTPNMTVRVKRGGFWKNEGTYIETPDLNTSAMTAPGVGLARYYVVCLRDNNLLSIVAGTAAASNVELPAIPAGYLPLAGVYVAAGTTTITNDMILDLRPFLRAGTPTVDHTTLSNRTTADAHPVSAITGLQAALDDKISSSDLATNLNNKADLDGTSSAVFILNKDATGVASENAVLYVNRGSNLDVGLRWNETTEVWEYTNDGIDWYSFTSPTLSNGSVVYASLDAALQTLIDDKAEGVHTHVAADVTDFTAAARTATIAQAITNGVTTTAPSQDVVFDALALKADASHTHVAADVTDFTAAAQTAAVAQAITNGVTATAPSQDVVFDALALKANSTHTHAATDITSGILDVAHIPTAIPATSIGSGTVDNTEFGYLNGVTSAIQTQFTGKAAAVHTHVANDITDFDTAAKNAAVADAIVNGVLDVAPSQDAVFDALALKADDGHTHVASDVTDFTSAAQGAVVTQLITSGVTDTAPSENAVFVALAGKSNTGHTHTAANITDFAVEAVSAVVTQVITNGVTNKAPSEDAVFDALAGKSNTGHTHVAADVTDFTTAARTATVAEAINNGTLDVAPSQNAVFDALVLKQDVLGAGLTLIGQGSQPATPATGNYILFVLSSDGKLRIKDDTGTVTIVGTQA